MPILVSIFSVVAVLSVLSVLLLFFRSNLPEPLRGIDGGNAIAFAFFVYFIGLVSLVRGVVGWSQVREVFRSRHKFLFSASALVVIAFVALVSFVFLSLSQWTDL